MPWRPMQEWRDSGPKNGQDILVLFPDCTRAVAVFDGYGQRWTVGGKPISPNPVAWDMIPEVPAKLIERNKQCDFGVAGLECLRLSSLY